ncbi:flagellar hook-associated protein FlgK [Metabacillus malikii]|uniref:Flagellar hook-associated protein 1 n=1 Tax=Metabacillus malikii TaxID=1504265 RepID=A0ABT9ZGQ8_9BACI|nr:flagellar hook-associated protein FlgK [Metabacillus malikii]MDQ0231452.1 flagellar hook-associated protein 1 FlgK [Metabacillus malikii]
MRSTFMGLETARRGMFTQQSALHTTGNNIANANTPGYTRQRVNFQSTSAYPAIGQNSAKIPGQMGTGVEAGSVQRIREGFLDTQYRSESNKLGYWETRASSLEKMEEIMNEPSDTGLAATMDQYWQSLQDLAVNPTNAGARAVVRERGKAVAETFQYLSTSLKSVQTDLKSELDISVKEINSIAKQLNNINQQIARIEPNGFLPNDLYDERDVLLDKLSSLANVKVTYEKSGGNALEIAEGTATVQIVDDNDNPIGTLVDGTTQTVNSLSVGYNNANGYVESVQIGTDAPINVLNFNSTGKISSLIDSYGYTYPENGQMAEAGLYSEMLDKLDVMAYSFATEYNNVHSAGWTLADFDANNQPMAKTDVNFFSFGVDAAGNDTYLTDHKGAASKIQITTAIKASTNNIAASFAEPGQAAEIGNGQNAINLAEVKNKLMDIGGTTTTFQEFYESVIGGMAVDAQEANRLTANSTVLRDSVDQRRQSVSAVSLDEEMTNMIQFQHAYNASAKMISLQDELLDTIINRMGI